MYKLKKEVVRALLNTDRPLSIPELKMATSTRHESRIGSILREMEQAQELEWIRSMGEYHKTGYQLTPIEVVLALIKLGYEKTHESEYGNHYTTQFKRKEKN